jgi:quercetin dioxygenase-like cupin family protein
VVASGPVSAPPDRTPLRDSEQSGLSRVSRATGSGSWEHLASRAYKRPDGTWTGITRTLLAGGPDSGCAFELRYFELGAGGRSAHERHRHQHAVLVLRGRGEVLLGGTVHELASGDLVHVAAGEAHQFRNPSDAPFGFLCVVDSDRDAAVPVTVETAGASCSMEPERDRESDG